MADTTLTALLWPALDTGWEVVAELDQAGITAKIDAVRAGRASTRTLPADVAAKLVGELDDPTAAADGDTRLAVRAALGEHSAATVPARPRRTPSDKIFDGDPATVDARLRSRRQISPALCAAYLRAAPDAAAAVWPTMCERGNHHAYAAVIASQCGARGTEFAGELLDWIESACDRRRYASAQVRERAKIGAHMAGDAWLAQHGTSRHHIQINSWEEPPPQLNHPVAAVAGPGIAAVLTARSMRFCGPAEFGAGALSDAAITHGATHDVAHNAAASGIGWATIADRLGLAGDVVNVSALSPALAGIGDAGAARVLADAFNTTFADPSSAIESGGAAWLARTSYVDLCGDRVDPRAMLGYLEALTRERSDGSIVNSAIDVARYYLCSEHRPSADDIAALAADPVLGDLVHAAARRLVTTTPAGSELHDGAGDLWVVAVERVDAATLAAAARQTRNRGWLGAWARHIDACIAAHDHLDRSELWAATLAVVDGFDGTTRDAVDVAAAVLEPAAA
jgi:hypothetical protein